MCLRWAGGDAYPGFIGASPKGPKYALPGQGCQGTASRHQRGPQSGVFKAERHPAVPMVFLRTFDNMTVSLGWGLIAGHKKGGDTLT